MISLQDTFAPKNKCFGCGPANQEGLQIKSFLEHDYLVANFSPKTHHQAFENILSGGICGTLLDCHSNWCAAYFIMQHNKSLELPATVTANFTVELLMPTPMDQVLIIKAWPKQISHNKALIEANITANNQITANFKGLFISVKEGHPAYNRW